MDIQTRRETKLFEDIFTTFHKKNKEILVIGVWGKDGLELEKQYFSEVGDFDLEFSGAEIADITSKLDGTRISPETFFIKLNFHKYFLIIFSLTPDYFLMILSGKDIIDGRLKFYLNLYKEEILTAL